ncbi:MAG: LAO/AO transport system kinase [Cyclobacteriaceae bacterium]
MESLSYYKEGIRKGDRVILSRAITLVESKNAVHQKMAEELLDSILPDTGKSIRLGITGVPGVGKSTFIDSFGSYLTDVKSKKIAVLSIDPSSSRSRGSILGDKTRMDRLSRNKNAYVRPSPAGTQLGGVAHKTRESMLLCEAAGYEIIIVETVGVGQSETSVRDMVDFFLLLMLAGGGDELQGIKRGIMEMADMVLINKVDGDNEKAGKQAKSAYQNALHLFPANTNNWVVPVETVSAIKEVGLDSAWQQIDRYNDQQRKTGWLNAMRSQQYLTWFHEALRQKLEGDFYQQTKVQANIKEVEQKIADGSLSVRGAVQLLTS